VIWIALSIGMLALLLFSLMSIAKQQDRTATADRKDARSIQRSRNHGYRVKGRVCDEDWPTSDAWRPAGCRLTATFRAI
jgi:hypothetical protein